MSTNHIDVAPVRWRLAHTALACGIARPRPELHRVGLVRLGRDRRSAYPLAIVAVVAGLRARRDGGSSRALGTAAVALGVIVVLIPLAWIAA